MKKEIETYANKQRIAEQKGEYQHLYFNNGTIKAVGKIVNGLKEGEWKFYRKSGPQWKVEYYHNGVKIQNP